MTKESEGAAWFHDPPVSPGVLQKAIVILWHGAGGDVDHPALLAVSRAATGLGARCIRARFDYRVAGRRAPDRMPKLLTSAERTIAEVEDRFGRVSNLVLGGRSMGGRVASMLVANPSDSLRPTVSGLIFLSYPLHPPKKLDQLRDEHLERVDCPMLFLQGDRDALCDLDRLKIVLARLKSLKSGNQGASLETFEKVDHSLKGVPDEVITRTVERWLSTVFSEVSDGGSSVA